MHSRTDKRRHRHFAHPGLAARIETSLPLPRPDCYAPDHTPFGTAAPRCVGASTPATFVT